MIYDNKCKLSVMIISHKKIEVFCASSSLAQANSGYCASEALKILKQLKKYVWIDSTKHNVRYKKMKASEAKVIHHQRAEGKEQKA